MHNAEQQPNVEDFEVHPAVDPMTNRKSNILRRPLQRYDISWKYNILIDEGEPLTLNETRSCEQKSELELVMQEEIKALHANDTWDMVELPKGKNVICNWWLKQIKNVDGKPK